MTFCIKGYLKEGLELLGEALNLFNNVYGAIHWEISACYRHIARLNYMMGDHAEAIANQQKAVIVSERVFGECNRLLILFLSEVFRIILFLFKLRTA